MRDPAIRVVVSHPGRVSAIARDFLTLTLLSLLKQSSLLEADRLSSALG